ncbi:hypothetical protein [Pseudoneobacillus rhizosphaerae]|nr:hypothetical protein [Pseudoneobacillus rhizosphaerae]
MSILSFSAVAVRMMLAFGLVWAFPYGSCPNEAGIRTAFGSSPTNLSE